MDSPGERMRWGDGNREGDYVQTSIPEVVNGFSGLQYSSGRRGRPTCI
jgi:hypothetical protein